MGISGVVNGRRCDTGDRVIGGSSSEVVTCQPGEQVQMLEADCTSQGNMSDEVARTGKGYL